MMIKTMFLICGKTMSKMQQDKMNWMLLMFDDKNIIWFTQTGALVPADMLSRAWCQQ